MSSSSVTSSASSLLSSSSSDIASSSSSSAAIESSASSQSSSSEAALLKGVFIDGVVGGIHYQTETQQGVTDAQGTFNYRIGETITFSIGNLTLPPALAQATLTPNDLAPNNTTTQTNILQLLQTLDADGNHDNGIQLRADAAAAFANIVVDITQEAFDTEIAASLQALDQNLTLSDATKAQDNFDESLRRQLLGSWLYSEGEGKRNLLTFLPNNSYLILHEHDDPLEVTNPQTAGSVEFGRYWWSNQSGELAISLVAESDGTGGILPSDIDYAALSLTLKGNQFELTLDQKEKVLFTRVASEANPLVGTWVINTGDDAIEVVSILSDNQYAVIHTQNTGAYGNNTAQALAGEWGDYTLTTNGFQATGIQAEADGSAGFYNQTLANAQTVFGLEQNTWGEISFTQADQTTSYTRAETFAAHLQDDGTPLQTITVNRAAQGFSADEVINSNWAFAVAVAGMSDCDPQTDQGCGITFELEFTSASSGKIKEASEALNEKLNFTWSLNNIGTLSLQFTDANNEDFVMTLAKLASNAEQARVLLSLKGSSGEVDLWESQVKDFVPALDSDNDGISDELDPDDDNDGVLDFADAFPFDATESIDTDMDGIGNNADTDDDNDMVADIEDAFPLDANESVDTDMDGIGNNADTDDDNDGVADTFDAYPMDADFVRASATSLEVNSASQFTIYGGALREGCGINISPAGDMNNDGNADFVIGCGQDDNPETYTGHNAYLIFGPLPTAGSMELSQLDGSNGVILQNTVARVGASNYGHILAGGKDVNGDGIDDLVLGDYASGNGKVYVVFGRASAWPSSVVTNELDGINGAIINLGAYTETNITGTFIFDIALSPDLNNDGIAEIVIAGTETMSSGLYRSSAYVIYGQSQWPSNPIVSHSMYSLNGTNGFVIRGHIQDTSDPSLSDWVYFENITTGKDFNGDNLPDIAVTEPSLLRYYDELGYVRQTGKAYVISPNAAINGLIDLRNPNVKPLLTINSDGPKGANFGDIQLAGDLNQDGFDDLLLGGLWKQGKSYAIFGSSDAARTLSVTELDGQNGFTLLSDCYAPGSPIKLADLGDINNDGNSDFGVTFGVCDQPYIIEGGHKQWQKELQLTSRGDPNDIDFGQTAKGFVPGYYSYLLPRGQWGNNIVNAGDLNGDGVSDLLVSIPTASNPAQSSLGTVGAITVIFGCHKNCIVSGTDTDNDGTPDLSDAFPTDPAEALDSDGDGIGNNADLDDDNDGVDDSEDAFPYNPDEQSDSNNMGALAQ